MYPDFAVFLLPLAAELAIWFGLYGIVRLVTRPAHPRPGPATLDLSDEPPAVVNLLVNRWRLTEDAEQAILLDLAATGQVELVQPGDDPAETTVRPLQADSSRLTSYERRVLDRVAIAGSGRPVPLSSLSFRDDGEAKKWRKRLHAEIIADARSRGLSRRRFGPAAMSFLACAGVLIGAGAVAASVALDLPEEESVIELITIGLSMAIFGLGYPGERDTAAGRAAAAHWLGVRSYFRRHRTMEHLPPVAATHWGRRMSYGAALGVTRKAGSVLDLGMGSRNLVWSQYGGTWHRVRVSYPGSGGRLGAKAGELVSGAFWKLGIGLVLVVFDRFTREVLSDIVDDEVFDVAEPVALIVGVVLLALGSYTLVRVVIDLAGVRTVTGEVLWIERLPNGGLDYLAIDDGASHRTVAWLKPRQAENECRVGDTVRTTAYPWTRRVRELTVLERSRRPIEPGGEVDLDQVMAARTGDTVAAGSIRASEWIGGVRSLINGSLPKPSSVPVTELLTSGEVSQALRRTVRGPFAGQLADGSVGFIDDQGRTVLEIVAGPVTLGGRMTWSRLTTIASPVPGLDSAFIMENVGVARVNRTFATLMLTDDTVQIPETLSVLLTTVVNRLSSGAGGRARA